MFSFFTFARSLKTLLEIGLHEPKLWRLLFGPMKPDLCYLLHGRRIRDNAEADFSFSVHTSKIFFKGDFHLLQSKIRCHTENQCDVFLLTICLRMSQRSYSKLFRSILSIIVISVSRHDPAKSLLRSSDLVNELLMGQVVRR